MASTYSDLKIELIGTGEQSGTWGVTTNTNLGTALEEAIVGLANANYPTNADLTLTLTNSNATQVARHFVLNVTSSVSLTTTRNLIVPAIEKPYLIANNTTGGQSIIVKNSTGTGVTVPNGAETFVYNNGTNVIPAIDYLPTLRAGSMTLDTALPILSGGTGATTDSGARTALGLGALATQGDGDKGDITVSASGATWTVDNQAITFAKIQNVATTRLAGRSSPGAGSLEEISVGSGLSLSGGTLSSTVAGGGGYDMQAYASPGTWTKPAGLKAVKITVVGGGGGGGRATGVAAGGGGGGAAISVIQAPSLNPSYPVTVGGGGTTSPNATGGTGGTSSFGSLLSATGGVGGATGTDNVFGGNGGLGSSGTLNIKGGAGGSGAYSIVPGPALPPTYRSYGAGGTSILGGGDSPGGGGNYGGGGSGNPSPITTGTGGGGVVIVEEFY